VSDHKKLTPFIQTKTVAPHFERLVKARPSFTYHVLHHWIRAGFLDSSSVSAFTEMSSSEWKERRARLKQVLPLVTELGKQKVSEPALLSILGGIDATARMGFEHLRAFNKALRKQLNTEKKRWLALSNLKNAEWSTTRPSAALLQHIHKEYTQAVRRIEKKQKALDNVEKDLKRLVKTTVGSRSTVPPRIGNELAALIEKDTGKDPQFAVHEAWRLLKAWDRDRTPENIRSFLNSYRQYRKTSLPR